jgi:putative ABC transport system permease protein
MVYIREFKLGFNKENVIILPNGWDLGNNYPALKKELLNQSAIQHVSNSSGIPSKIQWSTVIKAEGDLETDHSVFILFADHDYVPAMDMEIIYGRNFTEELLNAQSKVVLINQTAARQFGWIENEFKGAIGNRLEVIDGQTGGRIKYEIIGIIKDFNYASLRNSIEPLVILLTPNTGNYQYVSVKVDPGNVQHRIDMVKSIWTEVAPDAPFEYGFLDTEFDNLFKSEKRLGEVVAIFSILAILIACLGLLGLVAFTAEKRTKEIGIRKVMGASILNVIYLLNKEFTKLVIVSFIISIPLAWYVMERWLSNFNYQTDISIWPFIIAGTGAVLIAWITVSYQSIKASITNPVNSLRTE